MKRTYRWVGLVIFLLLGVAIAISPLWDSQQSKVKVIAKRDTELFLAGLEAYHAEYGEYPSGDNRTLIHILKGDNPNKIQFVDLPEKSFNAHGEFVDPWGHPYRVDLSNPSKIRIWSIGKDGKDAPDDPASGDIRSWD